MKRVISVLILCVMLIGLSCTAVSAANEGVMPRYNNAADIDADFYISENGIANITAGYTGYSGVTTGAKITILLEEKTFFFFWSDVKEWVITSSEYTATFFRSYAIPSGDYRVTITYEISGTGGATDVYEEVLEDSY